MGNGISFTGEGEQDASRNVSSTQQERGSRGSQGPIDMTGDGGQDTGGTPSSAMPRGTSPNGSGVEFTGNGGEDA